MYIELIIIVAMIGSMYINYHISFDFSRKFYLLVNLNLTVLSCILILLTK